MNPILQVQNLKLYFDIGKKLREHIYVKAVDDVSFDIQPGEVVGLVGESGSGKSTIAYTLMGMYKPTGGNIQYKGQNLLMRSDKRPLSLKKDLQIVFQDPSTSLNPHQNIKQILELPLRVHGLGETQKQRDARVKELLGMVELPVSYLYASPSAMGGGERQLISIARALASEPSMVILDEPTSALDVSIQAKIINMLLKLQVEKNLTYLFITHDLSLMRNIATKVAILYLGKLAEVAPTVDFFSQPAHPYTKMLLSSIPVISDEEEKLKPQRVASRGEIPSPVDIPPGCSFHQRCYETMEACKQAAPAFHRVGEGHMVRCHLCASRHETASWEPRP